MLLASWRLNTVSIGGLGSLATSNSPDLQVGLQFEFEAGFGGDLQMLLSSGRNDGSSRGACRRSDECPLPAAGDTADQGSQSRPTQGLAGRSFSFRAAFGFDDAVTTG